jgi:hypothetical protein
LQALGGSPYHFAYPGGAIDNEDAVVDAGMLTARTSDASPVFGLPSMNAQHLTIRSVTNAVSVATVQGWIDDAIATRKVLILLFHSHSNQLQRQQLSPVIQEIGKRSWEFTE